MNLTLLTKNKSFRFSKKTNRWQKLFFCLGVFFIALQYGNAQVSLYTYQEFSGVVHGQTYTPLVGGTDLFGASPDNQFTATPVPLGFTFAFNGIDRTEVRVSANGYIFFGGTGFDATIFFPIRPTTTQYDAVISGYGRDLIHANFGSSPIYSVPSSIKYQVSGTAGNRVFTVQYENMARKNTSSTVSVFEGLVNFQIKLYEGTNTVEIIHDTQPVTTTLGTIANYIGECGLRGQSNAMVNISNRVANSTNYTTTTAGGANNVGLNYKNSSYLGTPLRMVWTPPACQSPTSPIATVITTNGATISWGAATPAPTGYQYEIRTSGAAGSGPTGLAASGSLAGISSVVNTLNDGTVYTLYVRSSCGASNSPWITGQTFTTLCGTATIPYTLYFDTMTDGFAVPALPLCMSNQNVGSGSDWATTNPIFAAGFFDPHLRYQANPSNPANTWFITKGITMVGGTTYRLSYTYGGSSSPIITNRMEVRYSTTGTAAGLAAGTQLDNHPDIKTSTLGNVVNFTAPSNGVYYFGFRAYSLANMGSLYLDDIEIFESNCLRPTGLNAPAVLISFNNATITWTAPSPAPSGGYAYYISTSSTPPTNSTVASGSVPAGTTITAIGSLLPSTTYYVWVRSSCGFGEFGEWSVGTSFTTATAPPAYCTPVGSSVDGQGITNVTFGSINNTTGNEAATNYYGNYSGLTTNVAQGATVPVAITLNTTFLGFPVDYYVNIWIDWNNNGTFEAGEEVYSGESSDTSAPTTLNASFNVPVGATLGPKRLRIGGADLEVPTPCRSDSWQSFEDYTINVIVAPPALTLNMNTAPSVCGFTNSPLVTITAGLSDFDVFTWTPSAGVTGTPATGFTFNTGTTTTYILTASQTSSPFSTNTATFVYVANETPTPITIATPGGTEVCPAGGSPVALSASGGVVSNVPVFVENFNSGFGGFVAVNNSVGGSNIPAAAWTIRNSGYNTGGLWNMALVSNDNTSFVLTNSDAQGSGGGSLTRTILTSPVIDLTSYTSATLSFYHYYRYIATDNFARVEVRLNGGGAWAPIATYTSTQGSAANFAQAFINLNPYVGNTVEIRFNFESQWGWGWAIDNFRVLGSATSDIVWSPSAGLYTDTAGTIPYTGTGTSVVYAMPTTAQVYTATATAPGPTFCQSTQTVSITITPQVGGTLSANQTSCDISSFSNITLSGHIGNIIRWEYANDAAFTMGVTIIANTTTTLTPAQFGTFATVRYFRAVVAAGTCTPVYSTVASVAVNSTTLTGTNTWSNGTPDITKRVIIAGNYTASANFSACSVQVLTGGTLLVEEGVTVTVQNEFVVDGPSLPNTVVFENGSSLIQNTAVANSGSIRYIRNSSPIIQYDYTYWSSPVANQVLSAFSPNTLALRFYVFNHTASAYQWLNVSNALPMEAAKGYIIRAPNTISTTVPAEWVGEFYGVPHNGTYDIDVVLSGNGDRNLIGNPYPSAIDADLLYSENSSVLNGNFYFWTHNTPITANNYNANDYATYNGVGGVGTAATTTGVNTTVPTGNIGAGQGFFIGAASSGTVYFNNSVRISGNNDLFYRNANQNVQSDEKHRFWLNIVNNQGAYKQMLVGYITGATNEKDIRYDANLTEAGNTVSLYSLLNEDKLTIQGRALPFVVTDEVPLGFRTTLAGNYSIQLENFDGLFAEGQTIYLEDKLLNLVHNLNEGDYNFSTEAGTFNDRFEVQFVNETLGVNDPIIASNAIVVYKNSETIFINSSNLTMSEVKLFDVRGRLITSKQDILASEVSFANLTIANQMILVQITTTDGVTVTKKVAY